MTRSHTGSLGQIPAVPAKSPTRVGRYDLIDRLATGGMAEIFLAVEKGVQGLERLVVVKRILPHLAEHQAFVDMFLQEARIVARLSHPNIVQIHELGEDGGSYFIAMEYVAGSSFRELLRAAARAGVHVPLEVALGMVAQACAGAHAAHELTDPQGHPLGLVHRDISPHNLMVTGEGHVKLLDFGIAKATEMALDEKTRTGALKGKVHYMSPEQCRQEPLDRRSDVFALGIVLWELITQRRLFKRDSELDTMQSIVAGEVWDPREFREDVPEPVVLAVMRALRAKKEERYKTADEMRKAILDAASILSFTAQPEEVGPFVTELLGEEHEAMATAVQEAMDRTMAGIDLGDETVLDRPAAGPLKGDAETQTPGSHSETIPPTPRLPGGRGASQLLEKAETKRYGVVAVFAIVMLVVAALAGSVLYWLRHQSPAVSGTPITFAWPTTVDEVVLASELESFRVYLERETHRPILFEFTDSYADASDKLVAGEVDFASLPPFIFLSTLQREPAIGVHAVNLYDGAGGNDGVLLAREDVRVQELSELKGKRWCFPDEDSTTGYVLPRGALVKAGLNPDVDVEKVRSGNHLQTLKDILSGKCDFGGTYSGNYINARTKGVKVAQLRQIAITGRAPNDAVVSRPGLPTSDAELVTKAVLAFNPREELGRATVGPSARISGFQQAHLTDWDDLKTSLQQMQALPKGVPSDVPPGADAGSASPVVDRPGADDGNKGKRGKRTKRRRRR
jgi:phosphate/phosphite/phosphonate ABC transporter binding protein